MYKPCICNESVVDLDTTYTVKACCISTWKNKTPEKKFLQTQDTPVHYPPINCTCLRLINIKLQEYEADQSTIKKVDSICCKNTILSSTFYQPKKIIKMPYECYICSRVLSKDSKSTCCKEFIL